MVEQLTLNQRVVGSNPTRCTTLRREEKLTSSNDDKKQALSRAAIGNEDVLRPLIERSLRPLFGFSLCYAAYSREQAFRITVSSFVKALRSRSGQDGTFVEALFREALAECGRTTPAGVSDLAPFGDLPAPQQPSLKIVREALVQLAPHEKAVLLLRDQCHLPFERISAILGTGVREARLACLAARERLRTCVQGILEKPAGESRAM